MIFWVFTKDEKEDQDDEQTINSKDADNKINEFDHVLQP
jgi:hypothetical protein